MSNLKKKIIFFSPMENGSCHDYSLMKKFFNPAISWFKETSAFLDLGFYGAKKDYLLVSFKVKTTDFSRLALAGIIFLRLKANQYNCISWF